MQVKKELPNVVLVDANAFVHKAFHGYMPMIDKAQKDQRVLYGLMQALYDVVKHIDNIDFLYFVFDPSDSSHYRKSVYHLYKENRPPNDPELSLQRTYAKNVLKNEVGLPLIEYSGYEADDAIGSLAQIYKKTHNVIIVSPDKDLFQLVDDSVIILRPSKKDNKKVYEFITKNGVDKYFGVAPHQIPDYLALVGDTSDNLPGIDRLGPKTASYLLKKYFSIEQMLSVIDDIAKIETEYASFITAIKNNSDTLKMVKSLATIKTDLILDKHINDCLNCANEIQNTLTYNAKLEILADHYNWKSHLISMFTKNS